ncbi:hypothetical protein B0O80DRAFT_447516 [Mortierella sp. GBAus27b]|nr:hypothetical protein B0O80DRAFT_447516 [Mortierella sp. GBAus27b]
MASNGNTNIRTARGPYQSLYQPPEPPGQPNSIHPLQSYRDPTTRPTATTMTPTPGEEGRGGYPMPPLTATGHILSSIGGMSGCYGIVGGIPGAAPYHRDFKGSHCAPNSMHHNYPSHQHHLPQGAPENASRSQHTIPSTKGGAQSSGSPMLLDRQQHSQQQPTTSSTKTQGRIKYHMPDIILTLPTPAETANASRREGYFAM